MRCGMHRCSVAESASASTSSASVGTRAFRKRILFITTRIVTRDLLAYYRGSRRITPAADFARETCRAGASTGRRAPARSRRRASPPASGVSFQPTAPRFCRSCSSLRAPMITLDTVGRCEQPVERDLRHGLAGLLRDGVERVDDAVEILVGHLRALVDRELALQPARFRQRLAAADLAGEAAPAERAPDHRADLLVERERHQLPLVVAADERVVRLVRDVAREAVLLRDGQRLHQVPAGEVRAADVADLAGAHQIVERAERFLDRRQRVEAVQLVEVDVVGAEAAQARLDRAGQVVARGADVVRSRPAAEGALGRDEHLVAPALDRLAEDLLGQAVRVDVGRVEHRDAGLEADVDEPRRLGDVARAPGLEELVAAAEGAGAEAERGDLEARAAELSVFHPQFPRLSLVISLAARTPLRTAASSVGGYSGSV